MEIESNNELPFEVIKLDSTAERYLSEGKIFLALECMERSLILRKSCYGPSSYEVWEGAKMLIEQCNELGFRSLEDESFAVALELLQKAEFLSRKHSYYPEFGQERLSLRASTFSHLGFYYRKKNKPAIALKYMERCLQVEEKIEASSSLTHLNMCAILSQLGRHVAALAHAEKAIYTLQEAVTAASSYDADDTLGLDESNESAQAPQLRDRDDVISLAIAYHNLAVELEYLSRFEECLSVYHQACELASSLLGPSHSVTQSLQKAMQDCKIKQNQRVSTRIQRRMSSTAAPSLKSVYGAVPNYTKDTRAMAERKIKSQIEQSTAEEAKAEERARLDATRRSKSRSSSRLSQSSRFSNLSLTEKSSLALSKARDANRAARPSSAMSMIPEMSNMSHSSHRFDPYVSLRRPTSAAAIVPERHRSIKVQLGDVSELISNRVEPRRVATEGPSEGGDQTKVDDSLTLSPEQATPSQ
jgi:tetratricopeptide (TPR) repeat protein